MGCAMSIDERELRRQLGAALDEFVPTDVPTPVVIRRGKAIVVRRRCTTIAALVSLIIAAAVVTPLALRNAAPRPAPTSPTHYRVTEHSAHLAHPLALSYNNNSTASAEIAYGTINNRRWWLTLSVHAGLLTVIGRDLETNFDYGWGGPPLNSHSGAPAVLVSNGGVPQLDYGVGPRQVAAPPVVRQLQVGLAGAPPQAGMPAVGLATRYVR